jgi:3'-phosphoadenosine 5'-phosphosulfate sulfotransferase (PAPS reductase)/FAD synthetase
VRSPFLLDGPACISFSGGRTSAYMLWLVLDANGGLPDDASVIFANTGREAEVTLQFVAEVARRWAVPIRWAEYRPGFKFAEVDLATASRAGEPFEALIRDKGLYLPNPVQRFCTAELKIKTAERMLRADGWTEWDSLLGMRADEPSRVAKIRAMPIIKDSPGVERRVPLAEASITKADVRDFWATQPFDLGLPIDFDGTTIDGNCDGCFLKPPYQRRTATPTAAWRTSRRASKTCSTPTRKQSTASAETEDEDIAVHDVVVPHLHERPDRSCQAGDSQGLSSGRLVRHD